MQYGRSNNETLTLREAMSQLLEESFIHPARVRYLASGNAQSIPVNVFQSADNVVVFAPMPGLQPEDIEISVSGGTLTIQGKKRGHEERHEFFRHEWTVGPYQRMLQLPEEAEPESARASLDNGILVVTFNKLERSGPQRIEVRSNRSH
ncbi:MAG: Hsp20/alpha crystallin family protein [Chloroflexota bacterium]|nr:Hsp20/alpha crystallin family protein [Chloroflexota bacterium]